MDHPDNRNTSSIPCSEEPRRLLWRSRHDPRRPARSMPAPTGETTGSSVGHSLIVDAPLSVPLPEVEGVLSAAEVEQDGGLDRRGAA